MDCGSLNEPEPRCMHVVINGCQPAHDVPPSLADPHQRQLTPIVPCCPLLGPIVVPDHRPPSPSPPTAALPTRLLALRGTKSPPPSPVNRLPSTPTPPPPSWPQFLSTRCWWPSSLTMPSSSPTSSSRECPPVGIFTQKIPKLLDMF